MGVHRVLLCIVHPIQIYYWYVLMQERISVVELILIKTLKDATDMCQVKAQVAPVSHLGGDYYKLIYIIYIMLRGLPIYHSQ